MTIEHEKRTTRGRRYSKRTPEQAKERSTEQIRRYSLAAGRALQRLKREHEEEYFGFLDEELPKVYQERGPLPWENETKAPIID